MNRMATVLTELSQSDVYIAGAEPTDQWTCNALHAAINVFGFSSSLPPMLTPPITLVELPKSLRKGIDRRLPRGNRFKDLTGKSFGKRVVIGFAGFRGRFAVWLCQCKCGRLNVVEGARLALGVAGSCGCCEISESSGKGAAANPQFAHCPLPRPCESNVRPLWCAGHYGLQTLARISRGVRRRYGAAAQPEAYRGLPRWLRKLHSSQLLLGIAYRCRRQEWPLNHLQRQNSKLVAMGETALYQPRANASACEQVPGTGLAPFTGDLEAKQAGKAKKEQAADNCPAKVSPLTTQCLHGD